METVVDRFGRVVIPKHVRDDFGLRPGAVLKVEEGISVILLKPMKDEPPVTMKDGVLVVTGEATDNLRQALREHRAQRLKSLGGAARR